MTPNDATIRKRLGRRLRALREQAELTQEQVAERAGFSSGVYVSSIERGQRDLPLSTLRRISVAVGASLADLFQDMAAREPGLAGLGAAEKEEQPERLPRAVEVVAWDLARLPAERRPRVMALVKAAIDLGRR